MMAKIMKTGNSRLISLFSKEAGAILTHPVLQSEQNNVTVTSATSNQTEQPVNNETHRPPESSVGLGRSDLFCQSCRVSLADREEQVSHYRLDWHRYNLKRKLKGLPHVRQEDFEKIAGDLSSISGSESDSDHQSEGEEEEPQIPTLIGKDVTTQSKFIGSPYVHFMSVKDGENYAIYKNVLSGSRHGVDMDESQDLLRALEALKEPQIWIILMRAGGHFAGAVFKGSVLVAHKTFHRYTVRAKRGTAQSVRDSQGHAPKSAGATLRRYNETALVQEIQELISSWSQYVEEANAIFIRTPKYSRGTFISDSSKSGGKAPFSKDDCRLRNIPFATRRPTLKEVKDAHSRLAAIYVNVAPRNKTEFSKSPKSSTKQQDQKLNKVESVNTLEAIVQTEVQDEILGKEHEEAEVVEDTGEVLVSENGNAVNEKTGKKKKKKKRQKTTLEAIPEHIQLLLKLCSGEGSEDEVIEHLVRMNLTPQHSIKTVSQQDESITLSTSEDKSRSVTEGSQQEDTTSAGGCSLSTQQELNSEPTATADESVVSPSGSAIAVEELNKLWNGETVLHVAVSNGCTNLISTLLLYGANPAIRNQSGQIPYLVAKDKAMRDTFRRFMATYPSMYDYSSAQIPSPLTEDMERERKEKLAEKKKAQKKARKLKEKERKAEKELAAVADSRDKAVAQLSEREKRALAAEKRMASHVPLSTAVLNAGKCSMCAKSLAGVVPFERLQYHYCSMDCLKTHRIQLASKQ